MVALHATSRRFDSCLLHLNFVLFLVSVVLFDVVDAVDVDFGGFANHLTLKLDKNLACEPKVTVFWLLEGRTYKLPRKKFTYRSGKN